MKKKLAFDVLFSIFALASVFSLQAECVSLKTIYLTGKVRFVPAHIIDNESMPEGVFFEAPVGITSDAEGNVYICDAKANNIKKFDSQ